MKNIRKKCRKFKNSSAELNLNFVQTKNKSLFARSCINTSENFRNIVDEETI